MRQKFGDDTNTLMILWRGETVYDREALADIHAITRELEEWEPAVRVLSVTNMKLPRNVVVSYEENGETIMDTGIAVTD